MGGLYIRQQAQSSLKYPTDTFLCSYTFSLTQALHSCSSNHSIVLGRILPAPPLHYIDPSLPLPQPLSVSLIRKIVVWFLSEYKFLNKEHNKYNCSNRNINIVLYLKYKLNINIKSYKLPKNVQSWWAATAGSPIARATPTPISLHGQLRCMHATLLKNGGRAIGCQMTLIISILNNLSIASLYVFFFLVIVLFSFSLALIFIIIMLVLAKDFVGTNSKARALARSVVAEEKKMCSLVSPLDLMRLWWPPLPDTPIEGATPWCAL